MSARVHHKLAIALAFIPLLATCAAFFFVPYKLDQLYVLVTRFVFTHVHPFVATMAYLIAPVAYLAGPAYLTYLAIIKLIPARCAKCGNHAYRRIERGHWVVIFQLGESITYECRSCGHVENLGWYENPG
jgi:hypothetical protein